MTKYKEYFYKMLEENKEIFDNFRKVHLDYSLDQDKQQEKFNEEGGKVMDIIRDYENRLCANTERGMYNKYSGGLAEKFQEIIKSHFPLIDHVGLIVEKPEAAVIPEPAFSLKKISL